MHASYIHSHPPHPLGNDAFATQHTNTHTHTRIQFLFFIFFFHFIGTRETVCGIKCPKSKKKSTHCAQSKNKCVDEWSFPLDISFSFAAGNHTFLAHSQLEFWTNFILLIDWIDFTWACIRFSFYFVVSAIAVNNWEQKTKQCKASQIYNECRLLYTFQFALLARQLNAI